MRHAESELDRSGDRLFELPSRGWFVFQPPQLVAARGCSVSLRVNPGRLTRNLVAVGGDDVRLGGNDLQLRGDDVRLGGNDLQLGDGVVRLSADDVWLRGNDIRLPTDLIFNNLRKIGRNSAQKPQNAHPLIPSFSPTGGEGARRAVEGEAAQFRGTIHGISLAVESLHEPVRSNPFSPRGTSGERAGERGCRDAATFRTPHSAFRIGVVPHSTFRNRKSAPNLNCRPTRR
jgi:hypothetical protein